MERRSMFRAGIAGLFGTLSLTKAAAAEAPPRQRVVYHLSDLDRVIFVLGNMQNHVDGVGGPGMPTSR